MIDYKESYADQISNQHNLKEGYGFVIRQDIVKSGTPQKTISVKSYDISRSVITPQIYSYLSPSASVFFPLQLTMHERGKGHRFARSALKPRAV